MTLAVVVVCALLGVAGAGSGVGKLTGNPKVMESVQSVGVTAAQARLLGVIELAGAAGLLIGVVVPVIGLAAANGFVLYFAGAVLMHLRAEHPVAGWAPAAVLCLLAIAATLLQLQR